MSRCSLGDLRMVRFSLAGVAHILIIMATNHTDVLAWVAKVRAEPSSEDSDRPPRPRTKTKRTRSNGNGHKPREARLSKRDQDDERPLEMTKTNPAGTINDWAAEIDRSRSLADR
jgi:hypothetical protein